MPTMPRGRSGGRGAGSTDRPQPGMVTERAPHTAQPQRDGRGQVPSHSRTQPVRPVMTMGRSGQHDGARSLAGGLEFQHKYVIGPEIGRGGFGMVKRAEDRALNRELALKILHDRQPGAEVEFVEEAQITGQLEHPNIVPVYELGRDPDNRPYMAMKLVRGKTLQDIIDGAKKGRRGSSLADLQRDGRLEVFLKVCDAMAYAHSRRVIHRDLKPENVMVGEFGEVLVMDWGIARPLEDTDGDLRDQQRKLRSDRRDTGVAVTVAGDIFGTPAYMPPEQALGRTDDMDERSDVFSLGAVLYSLLTLELPYAGKDVDRVLHRARSRELKPPRQRAPRLQIPKELDAIVMRAMAVDPARRYATVADLRADITAFLASDRVSAYRDGLAGRIVKWSRRNPARATAVMFSAVLLAIVGGLGALAISALEQREAERLRAAQQRAEAAAEQARTEQRAAKEESARVAAEQAAREAELRLLVEEERYDQLRSALGARLQAKRDEIRQEFLDGWRERPRGTTTSEYIQWLGSERSDYYIKAYERVLTQAEHAQSVGEVVTAEDYLMLGMLLSIARRDPAAAEPWLTRGIELAETTAPALLPDLLTERGDARSEQRKFDEATADFNRALELDADNAMALSQRGRHFAMMNDVQRAMADFNRLIELYPNQSIGYSQRGWLQTKLRDVDPANLDRAIADFDKAIQRIPNNAGLYRMRGRAKEKKGLLNEAIADLDIAIRLRPNYAWAYYDRADCYSALENFPRALSDYSTAVDLSPVIQKAWARRGRIKLRMGDEQGALQDFQRSVEADDTYWAGYTDIGNFWGRKGDQHRALLAFQEAYKRCTDPVDARAREQLADVIRRLGGTPGE